MTRSERGRSQTIDARTLLAAVGPEAAGAGFRSIAAGIAGAIERGDLPVGARLPSERSLADAAGCSRGTVVAAYEVLRSDGLVLRRTGSGTWVRRTARRHDGVSGAAAPGSSEHAAAVRARRLTARVIAPRADDLIDLGLSALREPWELDPELLTRAPERWREVTSGDGYAPSGLEPLRAALAARCSDTGLTTTADQVTVTNGAQHALALATDLLVHPGDVVVVEQPTFPGAIDVFARAGARLVTVPVDAGGVDVAALRSVLERSDVRLVYLVPTCQSPTGSTMPSQRRREVAAMIDASDCWLIEDETLAPLHFDGPGPAPVAASSRSGRCLTIGSLSKEIWAGLGVGWLRADATTTADLARWRAADDLGSSAVGQFAGWVCLDGLEERTARLRRELSERADALTGALGVELPEWRWTAPSGGLSLWCRLPAGDGDEFAARAPSVGVAVLPGSTASVDDRFDDHVRLSFAAPADQLVEGVARLRVAWSAYTRDLAGG